MKKFTKKNAKMIAAVTLAASLVAAPSAFALNYGGGGSGNGNKPFNFVGYEVPYNASYTELDLFFNKKATTSGQAGNVVQSQFTVKNHSTGAVITQSTFSATSGKDTTNAGAYSDSTNAGEEAGTKVVIQFPNNSNGLVPGTLYDVVISDTVKDDNGLSIGNYYHGKDLTFTFEEPSFSGGVPSWGTTTPVVTYLVGDGTSNLSVESETDLVVSRPIDPGSLSAFLGTSGLGTTSGTFTVGYYDNTSHTYVPVSGTGQQSFAPISNDAKGYSTVFYYPEGENGSTTAYNRNLGHSYTLTPPTYTDINLNTYTLSSLNYTTASADYPGWEDNASSSSGVSQPISVVRTSATQVTPTFYDTWITPLPAKYNIYAIDSASGNKYSPKTSWNLLGSLNSTGTAGGTVTGTITNATYLVSGHTYYYVAVPVNSAGQEVGFSIPNSTAL